MTTREQIALAAFAATPRNAGTSEDEWGEQVAINAQAIHALMATSDKHESPILKAIREIEEATVLRGTIVQIVPNPTTKRWDVIMYSPTSWSAQGKGSPARLGGKELPPGYEVIPTVPAWQTSRFEAIRPQVLAGIGRQCLLWKGIEQFTDKSGMVKKARVLYRVQPLAEDPAFSVARPEEGLPYATPAQ